MRSPPSRSAPLFPRTPLSTAAAAAALGVDPTMLAAPTRLCAPVARARQIAVYLHHVAMGASLSDCARLFRRDRATVRHACARIEDMRDDPHFDFGVTILERALVAHRNLAQALAAGSVQEETTR